MQNPYGAVPDALQNTVKNLQWIAEQNAQGRRDENQSSLLLSNAEGEKAEIEAQILRDATQGDLSRTKLGIEDKTANSNILRDAASIRASDASTAERIESLRQLKVAAARENQVKTIGQHMDDMGAGHLKDLRDDVNQKISYADFKKKAGPIAQIMQRNPYGQMIDNVKKKENELAAYAQEISKIPASDPRRAIAEKKLNDQMTLHALQTETLSLAQSPSDEKIIALWDHMKPKNSSGEPMSLTEFSQSVGDARTAISKGRADMEKNIAFITQHGMTTAEANNEIARAQQNIIQSGNPDAIKANTWMKQELKKEKPDLGEVLRIAKGWNEHFSRPKTNLAQPSAAPSLKQTVNRPDAQNQETGVSIIDKIWYYTGEKTLKDLAISKQEREKRSKSLGNQIKDFITP